MSSEKLEQSRAGRRQVFPRLLLRNYVLEEHSSPNVRVQ